MAGRKSGGRRHAAGTRRPVVSLLTDFGLLDVYAGVMKGVILGICPAAELVDLTHGIQPQNVTEAAFLLLSAAPYFPEGTVHVAVVDPQVGTGRGVICARARGQLFLAPDNGLLSPLLEEWAPAELFAVENSRYFLPEVSRTFHGRDIFAPVAAHLARGLDPAELGPKIESCRRIELSRARRASDGSLLGEVIHVDAFGNLVTNIRREDLVALLDSDAGSEPQELAERFRVETAGSSIVALSETYAAVTAGALLALIGSSGRLEVSINLGNAAWYLGVAAGEPVRVQPTG